MIFDIIIIIIVIIIIIIIINNTVAVAEPPGAAQLAPSLARGKILNARNHKSEIPLESATENPP